MAVEVDMELIDEVGDAVRCGWETEVDIGDPDESDVDTKLPVLAALGLVLREEVLARMDRDGTTEPKENTVPLDVKVEIDV